MPMGSSDDDAIVVDGLSRMPDALSRDLREAQTAGVQRRAGRVPVSAAIGADS
jgi:hypothetical protein